MDLTDSVLADRYKVYGELCRGYYGITWGAFDLSASNPGNKVCVKVRFRLMQLVLVYTMWCVICLP